jgi:hypothetical protein
MPTEPPRARRWLDPDFRWRGTDISRMEALADGVFALALALLFLQATPPANLRDLLAAVKASIPFAITFVLLAMLWVEHHRFFRRYGLCDKTTFYGNLLLLFLVLFYAYPLKFVFTFLCVRMFGPIGPLTAESMTAGGDYFGGVAMMAFYSVGFGAIYGVFGLLYRHALRRAADLGLDAVERHATKTSVLECFVFVGFAGASLSLALAGLLELSGLIYFGIGPTMGVLGWRRGTAQERLVAARAAA